MGACNSLVLYTIVESSCVRKKYDDQPHRARSPVRTPRTQKIMPRRDSNPGYLEVRVVGSKPKVLTTTLRGKLDVWQRVYGLYSMNHLQAFDGQ